MHTVQEIREEYDRLDRVMGIDTSGIEIYFSPRAVYQYGCCRYEKKGRTLRPVKILIASFLKTEEAPFWDTVRHEYAHAAAAILTGKNHGHDRIWAAVCQKIGVDATRLAQSCGGQIEKKEQSIRYRIRCVSCGKEYPRSRKSLFVDAVLSHPGKEIDYRCCCGARAFVCEQKGE